jgi:hypothetical protein
MKILRTASLSLLLVSMGGCASIEFSSKDKHGLTYFEPRPHLLVTTTADKDGCSKNVSVIMIPGDRKHMKFKWGYGSSELSVSLTNGMVSQVGLKNDSKIPETIGAVANLTGAVSPKMMQSSGACETSALI